MANDDSWISPTSDNWSDPAAWSAGTSPSSTSDVTIGGDGTYAVTLDVLFGTVASLNLSDSAATLDLDGHWLTELGTTTLSAGTLDVDGGWLLGGTLVLAGGSLDLHGGVELSGVTVRGVLDFSANNEGAGIINGFTLENVDGTGPSTINLTGSNVGLGLPGTSTLDGGTINLTGYNADLGFGGTATLDDATVNIGNDTGYSSLFVIPATQEETNASLTLGSSLRIVQVGTFAQVGEANPDYDLINLGTITAAVSAGAFYIHSDFTNNGGIAVSNGDIIIIDGASFTNASTGTLTVGSESFLDIGQSSTSAPSTNDGLIVVTGGNADFLAPLTNSGTLAGYGLITATLLNNGAVTASQTGDKLEIRGSVSGSGSMTIAPGATLQIDGSLGAGQTIVFSPGAPETLIIGSPTGTISNSISGFNDGDKIEFSNGITINSASVINVNTLEVAYHIGTGTISTYELTNVTFAAGSPTSLAFGDPDPRTNYPYIMTSGYFLWVGGSGTSFGTPANWNNGTLVPGPYDLASFSNGVGGTISGTGSVRTLDFYNSGMWSLAPDTTLSGTDYINIGLNSVDGGASQGSLTIGSGSTVVSAGAFVIVGIDAGDVAGLTVSGGGVLQQTAAIAADNYVMLVGGDAASGTLAAASGSVLVTGTGSVIDLAYNGLVLGDDGGTGSVTVSQGGTVIATTTNSNENDSLAISRLGNATLTVTDPGSQVTAVGQAYIAHSAAGTLVVEHSGTFLAALDSFNLGGINIGAGSAVGIGGTGIATIETGGVLESQGYVIVGYEGTQGQLTVNSGRVQVGTMLSVGDGGTISNGATETGNGTLTIGPGGTVELTGTAQTSAYGIYLGNSNIGTASSETAVATVSGTGALLNTNGSGIAVGLYGTASLTVSQGGSVASGIPNSSLNPALGVGKQGDGTVTVEDFGSNLTAKGFAYFGKSGNGSLIVQNQGSVVIGLDPLDNGGLNIGGAGTTSTGILYVGGSGTADVNSNGNLTSQADITVGDDGDTGVLTAQDGTVTTDGQLLIGTSITLAPGTELITPTGTTAVTSSTVETGAGVVNVNTGGSLTTTGDVSVGAGGIGDLFIQSGANASIGGDLNIAQTAGGSAIVDIENPGGTVNIHGNLNVGAAGPGNLTVGLNTTVELDNGVLNAGSFATLSLYSPIDPPAVFNLASQTNIFATQTQTVLAYATNSGNLNILPGVTYTVDTPVISGTGSLLIGTGGAELILNADSVTGQTITFADATGKLEIGTDQLPTIDTPSSGSGPFTAGVSNPNFGLPLIGGFAGTIANFQAGDQITIDSAATEFIPNGSVVTVIDNGTTLGELTFASPAQASLATSTPDALVSQVPCFAPGTHITTPTGEVTVEHLQVGDKVLTLDNQPRPIVWIGTGRALATRGRRTAATPVIVRKGALADNVPHRDLRITKGHSLYIDGVLIPVEFLVNHRSILWDDRAQEVPIYHIELQTHDILIAEGAPAETYRDDGNRWLFRNANTGWHQPPKPPCAPVLTGGPKVDAIWRRLLDRAGPRPGLPTTADPDLHLRVDGNRIDGKQRPQGIHLFRLLHPPTDIRIVSRTAVPAELGLARDPRPLGVAIRQIRLWSGKNLRLINPSDQSLDTGFHAFEPANGLRWTDGHASLPPTLFNNLPAPFDLELHIGGTTHYPLLTNAPQPTAA